MQGFLVNIPPVPLATVVDSEPVPKDTLQDLQNELLATKARLQESEAKLKENEKALAQAKEEVGLLRERVTKEEEKEKKDSCPFGDRCPCCTKTFTEGLWHPASQKLYQHMGKDKYHRWARTWFSWDRTGWDFNFSY